MASAPLPTISVLVPAYRCADYIGDALRSLQAQTLSDWEAIVVDDGSPDDLVGAMRPFAADSRIRLLRTANEGVSAARNHALAVARAPLIALLDGDDRYAPDYLADMIHAIRTDERAGFATCDAHFFGNPRLDGVRFSAVTPMIPPVTLERVLTRQFNVFTACVLLATALQDVGGWTTDLRSAEDLDLWIRLLERGWQCVFVPRPLHHYRRRPDSLSSARLPLLMGVAKVYDDATARLAGRPEQRTAIAMRETIDAEIAFEHGEALVLAGDVGAGLRELRRAGARTRSLSWRVALIGMRLLPRAAPRFMRWRMDAAARG